MAPVATYLQNVSAPALRDRSSRRLQLEDELVEVRVRESSRPQTARIIVGPRRPLEVIVPLGFADNSDGFKRIGFESLTSARSTNAPTKDKSPHERPPTRVAARSSPSATW
jgi:hypothetical protein